MSLQVWMPLNGDLHNQGLSNITVSNNGGTIDNNGKIGKCYAYYGGTSTSFTGNLTDFSKEGASISCWINPSSWPIRYSAPVILSAATNWKNSLGFCTNLTSSDDKLYFIISDKSTYKTASISTTLLPVNTWSHITGTYDGTYIKFYLNGQLKSTSSAISSFNWFWPTTGRIGSWNATGTYYFDGKVNDVRIYDHTLSPKEVEEIAKGLVLHYKLDGRFCEATTNLCQSLVAGGQTTVSNGIITTTGNNKDTYWYIKPKEALVGGDKYTLSCYVTGFNNSTTSLTFGVGAQSGDNCAGQWSLKNGYNTFTFTMPTGKNGSTAKFLFDDSGGSRTQILTISNVQLEKKDHATPFTNYGTTRTPTTIYDSSGYSNNGTIIGSLTAAAPSPRYNAATFSANGAENYINGPILPSSCQTVSLWVKTDKTNNSARQVFFADKSSDLMLNCYSNKCYVTTYNDSTNYFNKGFNMDSFITNQWNHLVLVKYDNLNKILYINGNEITPNSATGYLAQNTGSCTIFRRSYNTSYASINTSISDVRIYTTALTAAQIKELYATSMSIDSSNNVYARELIESSSNLGINNKGQSIFSNFQENEEGRRETYIQKANTNNEQELNAYELYEY